MSLRYKRSRFSTTLPEEYLYTAGHYWLARDGADTWRVGLTKFATRMLGEIVEMEFEAGPGSQVATGQVIGWLEGFKAVADVFSPIAGEFRGANPDLDEQIELLHADPYRRGWLFNIHGIPGDGDCLDVQGYVSTLDATIDKMLGKRHEST